MDLASVALHANEPGLLEPVEVPRDQGLAHPESASDFGHSTFAPRQLLKNAQSSGVPEREIKSPQFFKPSNVHADTIR